MPGKSGQGEVTSPLRNRGFTYGTVPFQTKLTIAFLMLITPLSPSTDAMITLREVTD